MIIVEKSNLYKMESKYIIILGGVSFITPELFTDLNSYKNVIINKGNVESYTKKTVLKRAIHK